MKNTTFLLDIEGTTTPIAFVYDVLFPYARRALGDFVASTWDSPDTQSDVIGLQGVLKELEVDTFNCGSPVGALPDRYCDSRFLYGS